MIKEFYVSQLHMILAFSKAIDLIDHSLANHHNKVAYIAYNIAVELGLPISQQNELIIAGLLHDSGALSLSERLGALEFELQNPHKHSEAGYQLLKNFEPFHSIASLIRFHHVNWEDGKGSRFMEHPVPINSHILHLADRVSVLMKNNKDILGEVDEICEQIKKFSGSMFIPEFVDAFAKLSKKEYFWFDLNSYSLTPLLSYKLSREPRELNLSELRELANVFCHVIDFRSRFTATHSNGVATCSGELARLVGFSEAECDMIRISGYLHDLGKLTVPAEILEKPSKLSESEFNIIKSHTFYTYRILQNVSNLGTISAWAAYHHERLDGTGYPFHQGDRELSLGSKIVAVADVFTALTEDRPYRKGMEPSKAIEILENMVNISALDSNVVRILKLHYDEINAVREMTQAKAYENYEEFSQKIEYTFKKIF